MGTAIGQRFDAGGTLTNSSAPEPIGGLLARFSEGFATCIAKAFQPHSTALKSAARQRL
jgi:hypothetical protein